MDKNRWQIKKDDAMVTFIAFVIVLFNQMLVHLLFLLLNLIDINGIHFKKPIKAACAIVLYVILYYVQLCLTTWDLSHSLLKPSLSVKLMVWVGWGRFDITSLSLCLFVLAWCLFAWWYCSAIAWLKSHADDLQHTHKHTRPFSLVTSFVLSHPLVL